MTETKLTFIQWCKLPDNYMLKIHLANKHKVFWVKPVDALWINGDIKIKKKIR